MKKIVIVLLAFTLLLIGCVTDTKREGQAGRYAKYTYEFYGAFDTVVQFIGYAESEREFDQYVKQAQKRLEELHKLYDKYNAYEGINNIRTINENAGVSPVVVPQEIIDLLVFSKDWYAKTNKTVNIALGPVLEIWHDYREEGKDDPEHAKIPPITELRKAAELADIEKVIVDKTNRTVFLAEKGMSLDVGAVAKGYAAEIAAREMQETGMKSCVISCGGNVRLIGQPLDGVRSKWGIGIQNPNGNALIPDDKPLETVYLKDTSLVSSGDYQRYYIVDGKVVHHLIDPETLMPADHYRAVTVMTRDSGAADALSTAVFLLPYEKSRALVENLEGVEALWVFADGKIEATQGMKDTMKSNGASYK